MNAADGVFDQLLHLASRFGARSTGGASTAGRITRKASLKEPSEKRAQDNPGQPKDEEKEDRSEEEGQNAHDFPEGGDASALKSQRRPAKDG